MVIDGREIIPIYETSRQKKLTSVIRYFTVSLNIAGEEKERIRAEWYFPDRVEVYQQDNSNQFKLEMTRPHFTVTDTAIGAERSGVWGDAENPKVPFVELSNNMKKIPDLRFVKALIDAYDLQNSKFANDLEDLQEAVIKSMGTADKPSEIRYNLFMYKVWASSATKQESDLDKLEIQIPYEAKKEWMDRAEKMIATFGMSINPDTDTFGQNPSGVALNWLYLPLDLKVNLLQRKMETSLYELLGFVSDYFTIIGEDVVDDVEEFKFTFNKNMIANNREQIELANDSVGKISEETRLEHDPRVEDVAEEIRKMEEDKQKKVEREVSRREALPEFSSNGNEEEFANN